MNRFEYCHPDNNSDNDSFGSFLSKKSYLLQHISVCKMAAGVGGLQTALILIGFGQKRNCQRVEESGL
jgi:hypothetical protein